MTKRLIALLLSLIMVLACFVGCNQKDDVTEIVDEGSERTATLSMYLMSEEEVSAEQALAIQNAVNKITKSKFKTQLVLRYFTEDQYYTALEKAFEDAANSDDFEQDFSNALKEEIASETAEETYVDEYGVIQLKYPTITDYQVDIFYLSGYDRLAKYIENEWVYELSDEIGSASKVLKTFINPGFLNGIDKVCDGTYAVPGNAPIGEYTYILVNKEILKEYNHVASDFTSMLSSTSQYLLDHVSKYNTEFVPLRSFTDSGVLDVSYIRYFGIDENGHFNDSEFSLLGGSYDRNWKYGTSGQYSRCAKIIDDTNFYEQLETLVTYKEKGYYGTEADADKKFAMGYIKGGAEVYEQYGDEYEIIVHQAPELSTMDIFENMFAVGATSQLERSMEIITYLYSNADFANLLLYGIEGENYELVESDVLDAKGNALPQVKRLANNKYVMAPEKIGNMFLAYPTIDQDPNLREIYKQQNLDSSVSLVMGMMHNFDQMPLSFEHTTYLREQSKIVLNELLAIETVEELAQYIENLRKTLNSDTMLVEAMRQASIPGGVDENGEPLDPLQTLPAVYTAWLTANKILS